MNSKASGTDHWECWDTISVKGLSCEAIIGILPEERLRVQQLVIDISLRLDLEPTANAGDLDSSVDYARLADEVIFILQSGRFLLLESAAVALARFILRVYPRVTHVTLNLSKPEALSGAGIPHVGITRHHGNLENGFQLSTIIFACPESSLEILPQDYSPAQNAAKAHQKILPLRNGYFLRIRSLDRSLS